MKRDGLNKKKIIRERRIVCAITLSFGGGSVDLEQHFSSVISNRHFSVFDMQVMQMFSLLSGRKNFRVGRRKSCTYSRKGFWCDFFCSLKDFFVLLY